MKKLLHICIAVFATLLSYFSVSAQPVIQWQKALGGSGDENGEYIEQTADSGYIVAGYTNSTNGNITSLHDSNDLWVIKLTPMGTIMWQKTFGGTGNDEGTCVRQTKDGGYIVAGCTSSFDGDVTHNKGLLDAWIIKLDDTGKIVWQKTYGGSRRDCAFYIQQTTDSGFIFAGYSDSNDSDVSNNHGGRDCWVVKINDTGKIIWQKALGGSSTDYALAIQQTNDGGYITAGYTYSTDGQVTGTHGNVDGWVVKLNDTGAIIWQKALGGSAFDGIYSIQQTFDNGYIAIGGSASADGDVTGHHGASGSTGDIWAVKLNDTGAISWENSYGGSGNENANFVYQTPDSGYFIVGYTSSTEGDITNSYGNGDVWALKLTNTGVIDWELNLGGSSSESAYCGMATKDNGYAIAGWTQSNDDDVSGNHGGMDVWVVKLSSAAVAVPAINNTNKNIKVYPTLTNGLVKVEMPVSFENARVVLLNSLGQRVNVHADINSLIQTLDINGVPPGMYFLQIINSGEVNSFKILYRP